MCRASSTTVKNREERSMSVPDSFLHDSWLNRKVSSATESYIKFWRITKREYTALSRNYETPLPKEALVIGFVTVLDHQDIFLVFLFYLNHTFEFLKLKLQEKVFKLTVQSLDAFYFQVSRLSFIFNIFGVTVLSESENWRFSLVMGMKRACFSLLKT